MPTLSRSPRQHSLLTQAWSLPEGIICPAYRGSCVFLWGQFEKEGTAATCGHYPEGPGIMGTLHFMCLFTLPVPKPPQHTREEVGRADCFLPISQVGTKTGRGDTARERLETSLLIRLHFQSQIPMRHCRQCQVKYLNSGKGNLSSSSPSLWRGRQHRAHLNTSPSPLTLLNWKRSRLSLSRAGSCPGLRNRLILLGVRPSAERRGLLSADARRTRSPRAWPGTQSLLGWAQATVGLSPQAQEVATPGPGQLCHPSLPQAPSAGRSSSGNQRDLVPGGLGLLPLT